MKKSMRPPAWGWLNRGALRIGMLVRVKTNKRFTDSRDGGIVRAIEEDGRVWVEPDYPEVDENGEFDMWVCTKDMLLVEKRR